jgi:hypothetical protein
MADDYQRRENRREKEVFAVKSPNNRERSPQEQKFQHNLSDSIGPAHVCTFFAFTREERDEIDSDALVNVKSAEVSVRDDVCSLTNTTVAR